MNRVDSSMGTGLKPWTLNQDQSRGYGTNVCRVDIDWIRSRVDIDWIRIRVDIDWIRIRVDIDWIRIRVDID